MLSFDLFLKKDTEEKTACLHLSTLNFPLSMKVRQNMLGNEKNEPIKIGKQEKLTNQKQKLLED